MVIATENNIVSLPAVALCPGQCTVSLVSRELNTMYIHMYMHIEGVYMYMCYVTSKKSRWFG